MQRLSVMNANEKLIQFTKKINNCQIEDYLEYNFINYNWNHIIPQFNFTITPFVENDVGPTSSRWDLWKDQFCAYLALKNVTDHEEMYKALMCFGGPDVRKIAQNVPSVVSNVMDNPYRIAMEVLDNYYAPRMSLRYERFKFRQMMFNPDEKIDQFVIRLRSQAALCNFDDQLDQMLMDQIVVATQNDDKLRAKYLEADVCLDDMLKIGRTHESVRAQVMLNYLKIILMCPM